MRYAKFLCCALLSAILFSACKKDSNLITRPIIPPLIEQAHIYFNTHFADSIRTVQGLPGESPNFLWDKAFTNDLYKTVIVPVEYQRPDFIYDPLTSHFYSANSISQLVLFKDSSANGFSPFIQVRLPDLNFLHNPTRRFTGTVYQQGLDGKSLAGYRIADSSVSKPTAYATGLSASQADNIIITTCTTIYGYNYPADDPNNGYSWETTSCNTTIIEPEGDYGGSGGNEGGGGGNGGSSGSSGSSRPIPGAKTVAILPPSHSIVNIQDYLHCFTNSPSASYEAKVCVDQPTAGSRTPWALTYPADALGGSNPFDVGHTFLTLTETDGNVTTVRNIGFYPSVNVFPWTGSVGGVLNNDESHHYNISASFNISPANFFSLLSYIQGSAGQSYNLNTNNCTTWALNALSAGHIYLPSTYGYWPGGIGNDPGDLGEDIRLSNAPGIVKSTAESLHENSGSCQ